MTSSTIPQITAQSWMLIGILGIVWGGTFMVTEIALTGMTPFWIAAARVGLAAAVLSAVWAWRGWALFQNAPSRADLAAIMVIGVTGSSLPFALLAWGQQYVTSGFAGVSMASTALIILPLAHIFVPGDPMTLRRCLGFAVGFVGVVILIGTTAFESSGARWETGGRLACIGASCCYAISSILMRRLPPIDPIGLAAVLLVIGAVVSIPMAFAVEGLPNAPSLQIWVVLVFLGLVPTAAAAFLRVLVVRSAGPVFMSLVNYQVPVWSVLLGALVLSEPLPAELIYALAFILAGLAVSQYGALRRLFGSKS